MRKFCRGCASCASTKTVSKPAAGLRPIVAKSFLHRLQMDLVDMQRFKTGLYESFQDLSVKSKNELGDPVSWQYVGKEIPENSIPAYILNIADHASKVGKSYALPNKTPEQVVLCLLDFLSSYGVPTVSADSIKMV